MKFREFQPALCEEILEEIDTLGFTHMTPVQAATLPLFLSNKDVAVDACTGSGKTLSFILPMVQMMKNKIQDKTIVIPKVSQITKLCSMVLSPTRELARQIHECAVRFFQRALPHVQVLLFVGGTSVEEDLNLVRQSIGKLSVVIGTPGRIEDLMRRCHNIILETKEFEILILDEADTLLDMGFEVSINNILSFLPKQRRTGLFSATQTSEVKALARAGLRNPATISVQVKSNVNQIIPTTLSNYYAIVEHHEKFSSLIAFIKDQMNQMKQQKKKFIIFFSTCSSVDFFGRLL
jgi:ATP-dependent RNA helicase DDX55/SPB4